MNLYLVRHSDSEKTSPGKRDRDRRLTKEGKEKISAAAYRWKYLLGTPDFICTSPYIRAIETAELIAKAFDFDKEIIKDSGLSSGSLTKDLITLVNSLDGEEILIVGHQPDLSEHVSGLISSGGAFVDFKKAAIAKISFNGKVKLSKGYLEFLIPADAFLK